MRASTRRTAGVAALALALILTACGRGDGGIELEPPATKVKIEGTDRYVVHVTEKAAERLDIDTTEVSETERGLAVPSAAVILEPDGRFWVYVTDEPLAYYREEISPVREEGGWAYYQNGPGPGTTVVIESVAELWGEETGVGK